eukprot:GHUV01032209.1.p1 GENE.GHUV01032209.1~~GHUV01032209.1.p1  ORF type:complete len:169 (+),score=35.70 GHUV01032209.1:303-809(+)
MSASCQLHAIRPTPMHSAMSHKRFPFLVSRPAVSQTDYICCLPAACRLSPVLYKLIHSLFFRALLLRPARKIMCPMVTVSQLIKQYSINEVGLLKINVERAEWDVLAGIADKDWPKIRQVSVQVHNIRGRVQHLKQLLQSRGFEVDVYQEPRFRECNLHMVYGWRPQK